jgi:hypothetical protein
MLFFLDRDGTVELATTDELAQSKIFCGRLPIFSCSQWACVGYIYAGY